MNLAQAIDLIVDDGIEAARADYRRPDQAMKLAGSIRGFEDCRGKGIEDLVTLLEQSAQDTHAARQRQAPDYWFRRCRQVEVEWVANVVSAILINQGLRPICTVTARGMLKAADVIGVAPSVKGFS